MKSFHTFKNVKTATAAMMGRDMGRMMLTMMRGYDAPSMSAASSYSMGMVRKYCTSMKIKNAWPKNEGTNSGRKVPSPPSQFHSTKVGIMVTEAGIISVPILSAN